MLESIKLVVWIFFPIFLCWSSFFQEYCKMNFLGNLFLHLKNFTILGPHQMGGMILTNSSEQHVCFMMLLEYDFSCSFVLLLQMNFCLCIESFSFHFTHISVCCLLFLIQLVTYLLLTHCPLYMLLLLPLSLPLPPCIILIQNF